MATSPVENYVIPSHRQHAQKLW